MLHMPKTQPHSKVRPRKSHPNSAPKPKTVPSLHQTLLPPQKKGNWQMAAHTHYAGSFKRQAEDKRPRESHPSPGFPMLFSRVRGSTQLELPSKYSVSFAYWFGTNSDCFSLLQNGLEWNSDYFYLPRNGSERNYEVPMFFSSTKWFRTEFRAFFYLLRNGSERNSKGFPFRELARNRRY